MSYNQLSGRSIGGRMMANDAAIASGLAFLNKELEKYDDKLLEPLTSTSWPRDIPVRTGGGFLESVRAIAIQYMSAGAGEDGIITNKTNNIPMVDADLSEQSWRVFSWANTMRVSYIDQQKIQNIGRSLDDMLQKGVKLNHDKTLDENVYIGLTKHGTTGLVNNSSISRYTADPHTENGSDTQWSKKTPDEILFDVNKALVYTWQQAEYDTSGMANHILLPPQLYTTLVTRKVGVTGDKSLLTFLMENNIGENQGQTLSINPCRWCQGAGTSGSDRMVCYANREDRVRFDMTVPMRRWITEASAIQMAYITPFVAQFSEVQFLYEQPVVYVDGI